MDRKIFIYLFFVMIIFLIGISPLTGDDHLVQEESRSYHGHTSPKTTRETWFTDNKACIDTNRFITILRYDLGKQWSIYPELKAYRESPIDTPTTVKKESIHEIGWDYTPQYDWIVEETGETKIIAGRECKKIIAQGEADYAEQTIEMFISKETPIKTQQYSRLIQTLNEEWKAILTAYPELKNSIIVQTKHTRINPIAPPIINEVKIVKVEAAEPPPNIYELPEGFEKVDTPEELFRRKK